MVKINKTMMQYFEWYLKSDCNLWNNIRLQASYLETIGITTIWLPPAYKCAGGKEDTGYGVYDLYDLGEFNQKCSIETKYGKKEEYLDAIKSLKGNGIEVLADIVFNHRMGADDKEEVFNMRYEEYLEKTAPLIEYYEEKGVLNRISETEADKVYEVASRMVK